MFQHVSSLDFPDLDPRGVPFEARRLLEGEEPAPRRSSVTSRLGKHLGFFIGNINYPLVMTNIAMENHQF